MATTAVDAVADAMSSQTSSEEAITPKPGIPSESPLESPESPQELPKEEKEEPAKQEQEDPQRIARALQILEVLEDPSRQRKFIKSLAVSLEDESASQTPQAAKETAEDFLAELRRELGDDKDYLLEPVLKVVNKVVAKSEERLAKYLSETEARSAEKEITKQYTDFMKDNEVSEEEQGMIVTLAKEFPPSPELSMPEYLKRLRRLAKSEMSEKQRDLQKSETNSRNREKAKFDKGGSSQGIEKPILRNAKDAVLLALQQLSEK